MMHVVEEITSTEGGGVAIQARYVPLRTVCYVVVLRKKRVYDE